MDLHKDATQSLLIYNMQYVLSQKINLKCIGNGNVVVCKELYFSSA